MMALFDVLMVAAVIYAIFFDIPGEPGDWTKK